MTGHSIRRVAVVGLGLLGGSLAGALRARKRFEVLGYARRQASIDRALSRGWLDRGSTVPGEVLSEADLTVLCLPPRVSTEFAQRHAALWRPGSLVTDVGSVKQSVVRGCTPALAACGVRFVGSHPMAGSERSGLDFADPALYEGAVVFLTPTEETAPAWTRAVAEFWREVGAVPRILPPAVHDRLTARTSHALHLIAVSLVRALFEDSPEAAAAAAGAFRDMTRIAASPAEMWVDIIRENRENVVSALGSVEREIREMISRVQEEDWPGVAACFHDAAARRRRWQEFAESLRGESAGE